MSFNKINNEVTSEVGIIGAGTLGVSLAYHLRNLNISCTVFDKEPAVASHASGKNAGMMRQLYHHEQLTKWANKFITDMPESLKEKFFIQTGSIILGRELPNHHQDLFEQISIKNTPAIKCSTDGLLDSGPYVNALHILAKNNGAKFKLNTKVLKINETNDAWNLETDKGNFKFSLLVNAAGAWCSELLNNNFKNNLKLQAFARHLAVVKGFEKDYMPVKDCGYYWDELDSWYMRMWSDDSRLISVCDQEPCHPEKYPQNKNIKEQISEILVRKIPETAKKLSLGNFWHCYRTYTEDKLPVVGFDTSNKKLFWLAGFGGYGMSTSYSACLDAAKIIKGQNITNAFSPNRLIS